MFWMLRCHATEDVVKVLKESKEAAVKFYLSVTLAVLLPELYGLSAK